MVCRPIPCLLFWRQLSCWQNKILQLIVILTMNSHQKCFSKHGIILQNKSSLSKANELSFATLSHYRIRLLTIGVRGFGLSPILPIDNSTRANSWTYAFAKMLHQLTTLIIHKFSVQPPLREDSTHLTLRIHKSIQMLQIVTRVTFEWKSDPPRTATWLQG